MLYDVRGLKTIFHIPDNLQTYAERKSMLRINLMPQAFLKGFDEHFCNILILKSILAEIVFLTD